jgi:hypothetical protein
MILGRRQFLGAMAAGSAGLVFPRHVAEAIVPPHQLPLGERVSATLGGISTPTAGPVASEVAGDNGLLPRALAALQTHHARIVDHDVIGVVDFSSPSRVARLQLIDVTGGKVLSTHLVAHGKGSDPANKGWVEILSNRLGSEASCSGSFITGDTYVGKHGRSRRLGGLDPENSLAEGRGIVIHAASYVGETMALQQGRVGRSQGCFAVSQNDIAHVLSRLGPGRLLFAAK